MSAFEDFVQSELPKRGYLNTDPGQETIIIRRGAGPRQFDAVTLAEGEVLGLVGGVLTGVTSASLTTRKYVQSFTNQTTWTVTHNLNSENVIVQAFDGSKFVMIPDTIQIVSANVVELTFNSQQTGTVRVIFLD